MEKYLELIEKIEKRREGDTIEEIRKTLKIVKEIESYLVFVIRNEKPQERDKVLIKVFDKIAELENEEKKIQFFLPMLSCIDNELIKFDKRIFDYNERTLLAGFIENRLEGYIDYEKKVDVALVGIFWVIDGKLYLHREGIIKREQKEKGVVLVDSSLSHFKEWELHQKEYPYDDFATYPRGRVIYDVNRKDHIIYTDRCVKMSEINKIVERCYINKYVIAYDEHYRCDNCLEEEIWKD